MRVIVESRGKYDHRTRSTLLCVLSSNCNHKRSLWKYEANANGGWMVLNKLTCARSSLTVCSCADQSWGCDEFLMPQSAICASSCRLVPCSPFTCSKKPLSRPFRSLMVSLGSCSSSMVTCGNPQPDVNQVAGDISMPVNDNKGLVGRLGWGSKHSDCSQETDFRFLPNGWKERDRKLQRLWQTIHHPFRITRCWRRWLGKCLPRDTQQS